MEAEFWRQRWVSDQVGWHREVTNPKLKAWWPRIGVSQQAPVLVPLAGKSLDLHWLAGLGHLAVGVELSEIAISSFFAEAVIQAHPQRVGKFRRWASSGIELFQGDFFDFSYEYLSCEGLGVNWYDRAALVALPGEMRLAYMRHLAEILPKGSVGLLLSFEYPQHEAAGPPFSVEESEVRGLCNGIFACDLLDREVLLDPENLPSEAELAARPNRYMEKGMTMAAETVYRLERL